MNLALQSEVQFTHSLLIAFSLKPLYTSRCNLRALPVSRWLSIFTILVWFLQAPPSFVRSSGTSWQELSTQTPSTSTPTSGCLWISTALQCGKLWLPGFVPQYRHLGNISLITSVIIWRSTDYTERGLTVPYLDMTPRKLRLHTVYSVTVTLIKIYLFSRKRVLTFWAIFIVYPCRSHWLFSLCLITPIWYTGWMFNVFEFFMLCSPAQQSLYTLAWKHHSLFRITAYVLCSFLSFYLSFPSSCALFHTVISEHDCTPLQCFLQMLYTISGVGPFYFYCCDGVRLRLCGTGPLTGPLSIDQMLHEWIWSSGGLILTAETEGLGEKPVPVPLC
jgi:hypothetical protein